MLHFGCCTVYVLQRTMDNLLGRSLSGEEYAQYFGLYPPPPHTHTPTPLYPTHPQPLAALGPVSAA